MYIWSMCFYVFPLLICFCVIFPSPEMEVKYIIEMKETQMIFSLLISILNVTQREGEVPVLPSPLSIHWTHVIIIVGALKCSNLNTSLIQILMCISKIQVNVVSLLVIVNFWYVVVCCYYYYSKIYSLFLRFSLIIDTFFYFKKYIFIFFFFSYTLILPLKKNKDDYIYLIKEKYKNN